MAINFCKLNLWFSVLSKRIIVEICKKTPMIKAVISVAYSEKNLILSPNKTPKGLMTAKKNKKLKTIFLEYLACNKKVVNTTAIGILCTTTAQSKFVSALCIGNPSENACKHKLTNNKVGNCFPSV